MSKSTLMWWGRAMVFDFDTMTSTDEDHPGEIHPFRLNTETKMWQVIKPGYNDYSNFIYDIQKFLNKEYDKHLDSILTGVETEQ